MLTRLLVLAIMVTFASCKLMSRKDENPKSQTANPKYAGIPDRKWWKEAVVYQVYPMSFKDSDGDGMGDIKGIISKLDYIKSLGVDVVWLNPVYESPNDDNGYDISDYYNIMKRFGSMQDFETLLKGMHERGLKLVMDLVVNHSSDEHAWFKAARTSRDNPFRNYYHWWPAEKGKPTPRWSFFDVNSDAWKFDSVTNAYYLHYFSVKQPDLNWENPALRQEIYKMMNFWFDKGVDGFRMDVIPFISKDTTFPPLPAEYKNDYPPFYARGPRNHEYLQEMHREVLSKHDVMTVGEGAGVQIEDALKYVDPDRKELNMFFHFDAMGLDRVKGEFFTLKPGGVSLQEFKTVYSRWDSVFAAKGWGSVFLGNHDFPRAVSRWGNDSAQYRDLSAKMLLTFLLTMRATPYIYNGDELGMSNARFTDINDYRDIQTLNAYKAAQQQKADLGAFMKAQMQTSRDNARTPFQWDASANSGFTTGTPWIKLNPNYSTLNAAAQEKDTNSVLNYFRKMIKLRKDNPVLIYGKYQLIEAADPRIYAYTRTLGNEQFLVILNFSSYQHTFVIPAELPFKKAELVFSNYARNDLGYERTLLAMPYHAVVYRLMP
jgi:oligo-1,6-glucosidase